MRFPRLATPLVSLSSSFEKCTAVNGNKTAEMNVFWDLFVNHRYHLLPFLHCSRTRIMLEPETKMENHPKNASKNHKNANFVKIFLSFWQPKSLHFELCAFWRGFCSSPVNFRNLPKAYLVLDSEKIKPISIFLCSWTLENNNSSFPGDKFSSGAELPKKLCRILEMGFHLQNPTKFYR